MNAIAVASGAAHPLRVNPELIVSFADGAVTLSVPSAHRTVKADAATIRVLGAVADPSGAEMAALARTFTVESLRAALTALAQAGVVVCGERAVGLPAAWRDWGEAAWFLHLASKDTPFAVNADDQVAAAREVAASPPPARYKCSCGGGAPVALPRPDVLPAPSFSEVLLQRRTCRSFADTPVKLAEVAALAFYTGGVVFENATRYFGTVLKKCAPSPGARHGTEMYLALSRCEGVPPGVYHYCVQHHCLNRTGDADPDRLLPRALVGQDYFAAAPLVVFFTCVVRRLMWKYKGPRIYRLAHLEAGHYCQNFLLTGTALGLGVFCTGALAESEIEAALGIDGVEEIPLYTAGAGRERGSPYRREDVRLSEHLPAGSRPKVPADLPAPE